MVNRWRSDLAAVLAATVAGIVVLGVGGRLTMAGLAMANRNGPGFSWGGSLEVVLLGTFYGAIGGVLLAVLRRVWPQAGWWRGIGLGGMLLGLAWASSTVGRQTAAAAPAGVLTIVGISLGVFAVYGVVADILAGLWLHPKHRSSGATGRAA
ncbi:MAG: hypothetical protein WD802_00035 [Gemmatimonadaceae bacterium]